jgi:hypothetical protein
MITVMQNAYFLKAKQAEKYSKEHEGILFALLHEKRHYTKDELLCFTKGNQRKLDLILEDLEKTGTVLVDGWLVSLKEDEEFQKEICEELLERKI